MPAAAPAAPPASGSAATNTFTGRQTVGAGVGTNTASGCPQRSRASARWAGVCTVTVVRPPYIDEAAKPRSTDEPPATEPTA